MQKNVGTANDPNMCLMKYCIPLVLNSQTVGNSDVTLQCMYTTNMQHINCIMCIFCDNC